MTCRMCNEQDDFCDGNSSEELCKHCLDHCCEECFLQLETDEEYEHHLCNDCYRNDFFNLPKHLYKKEPEYFTFSYIEIAEYEEECRLQKIVKDACEKRKQEKAKQKWEMKLNESINKEEILEEEFEVHQWYLDIEEPEIDAIMIQ